MRARQLYSAAVSYMTPSGQLVASNKRPTAHLWFLLLPILTAGMGSFIVPLWALNRQSSEARRPKSDTTWGLAAGSSGVASRSTGLSGSTLVGIAAGLSFGTLIVFTLMALAPTDASGPATGPLSVIGTILALALIAAGMLCALRWRDSLYPAEVPA